MAVQVKPEEVSRIIKSQLKDFSQEAEVNDIGTVLQVGDGIARVYGLTSVMAGEMVEFPNDVMGMVLN